MTTRPNPDAVEPVELAPKAYLYGYPLVYSMREMGKFPEGPNVLGPAPVPINTFGYARRLLDPTARFVSPNNDTVYVIAVCDVRSGPLVLHVPDTRDRYYVLQFVDAWTNNFAYIGRRATGTAEARYVLVAPDHRGEAPAGMRVVRAPSGMFIIVGRLAVEGADDLPAVHALQEQFTLAPLGAHRGGATPERVTGLPQPDPRVRPELRWWEEFRVALAAFPPPAADAPFLAACERLGLTGARSPLVNLDGQTAHALVAGQGAAEAKLEELIKQSAKPVNGWQNAAHLFDYNLDYFELGTLDRPEWKIADRATAYVTRAVAARAGLWGNHGYEANYQLVYVDAGGQPLASTNRYELHLTELPPVDAFWSLTMYDAQQFYLVANPIHRYSIGDRTPGLMYEADGSVRIYMQADSPGPGKEANWLPTPRTGNFRPVMRMYQPRRPILDGTFLLPAITRVS